MKTVAFAAPKSASTENVVLGQFSEFIASNGVVSVATPPRKIGSKYQQLALINAANERFYITLSQGLSAEWETGSIDLGHLQGCDVAERQMQQTNSETGELLTNADGTPKTASAYFIQRPAGSLTTTVAVKDIVAKAYVPVAKVAVKSTQSIEEMLTNLLAKGNAASVPATNALVA